MASGRTASRDRSAVYDDVLALATAPEHHDEAGTVESNLQRVARVRSWLDATESHLVAEANRLADEGSGAGGRQSLLAKGGRSSREASKVEKRSATLASSPQLAEKLTEGETSSEHIDAVTNAMRDLQPAEAAELLDDPELPNAASSMPVDPFNTLIKEKARKIAARRAEDELARQKNATKLKKWIRKDGMYVLNGEFDPELGNRLFGVIDGEVDSLTKTQNLPRNDRTEALALVSVAERGSSGEGQRAPAEVVVVDAAALHTGEIHDHTVCETSGGAHLPPSAVERIMCESIVMPVAIRSGGERIELDLGRSARVANRAQRRALRAMYRTCAFGDCHVAFDHCEIHHLEPWRAGGTTDLANLLPLCSRHHHFVHDRHWRLELDADRTLHIIRPDGEHHQTVPIPVADLSAALKAWPRGEPRPADRSSAPPGEHRPAHNRAA